MSNLGSDVEISDNERDDDQLDDNLDSRSDDLENDSDLEEIDSDDDDQNQNQDEDSEDEDEEAEEDNRIEIREKQQNKKIPVEKHITPPFLTKYEKARIIGTRALQISKNSPVYVTIGDEYDPITIAELELEQKKIPFIIRRYLPDKSYEDWPLEKLQILF